MHDIPGDLRGWSSSRWPSHAVGPWALGRRHFVPLRLGQAVLVVASGALWIKQTQTHTQTTTEIQTSRRIETDGQKQKEIKLVSEHNGKKKGK